MADLIDAGRVKFYCVDSADGYSWSDRSVPTEERARRHGRYESWVIEQVLPWVSGDCGGAMEFATLGCSLGAFHAANFALKRADLFPLALCFSGNYDPSTWHAWGEQGQADLLQQPDVLRAPTCTATIWTGCAAGSACCWWSARAPGRCIRPGRCPAPGRSPQCLAEKGIRHELDLWGYDIPHDWPSWRAQLAHHLPRFC